MLTLKHFFRAFVNANTTQLSHQTKISKPVNSFKQGSPNDFLVPPTSERMDPWWSIKGKKYLDDPPWWWILGYCNSTIAVDSSPCSRSRTLLLLSLVRSEVLPQEASQSASSLRMRSWAKVRVSFVSLQGEAEDLHQGSP